MPSCKYVFKTENTIIVQGREGRLGDYHDSRRLSTKKKRKVETWCQWKNSSGNESINKIGNRNRWYENTFRRQYWSWMRRRQNPLPKRYLTSNSEWLRLTHKFCCLSAFIKFPVVQVCHDSNLTSSPITIQHP